MPNHQKSIISVILFFFSINIFAVIGPIPIYLNAQYSAINNITNDRVILDEKYIEQSGANDILELLSSVSEINLVNTVGNVPAIFLKGNEARHTLVLVDGVNIADISSVDSAAGYGLDTIMLDDIYKIEIIKRASSVLYGAGAIAGVINIITKKGGTDADKLKISYGSNNTRHYSFTMSRGDNNNYVRFINAKTLSDNISAINDNDEKDKFNKRLTTFKFGALFNKTQVDVSLQQVDNYAEYDNCFGSDDCLSLKQKDQIALSANHSFSNNTNTNITLSRIEQERDDNGYAPESKISTIRVVNNINLDNSLLILGLERYNESTDSNFSTRQSHSSKEVFLAGRSNIADIDVGSGLRIVNHDSFDDELLFNFSLAKNINSVDLNLSYAKAFNPPSLYQVNFASTQALQPEISNSIEVGLQKKYDFATAHINIYKNKILDIINYLDPNNDSGSPNFNTTDDYYYNDKKLDVNGVELALTTNIKKYVATLQYNYVKAILNDTSRQLRRPKHNYSLTIERGYKNFNYKLALNHKSSSIDDTNADNIGDVSLSGYSLVNFSSTYQNNNYTVGLVVNNIFDKDYETIKNYNQLGRNINLSLLYKF